jgi:hypothetical protein
MPARDLKRTGLAKATRFPAWRYATAPSAVIPGRERSERTRNPDAQEVLVFWIPDSRLRRAPE